MPESLAALAVFIDFTGVPEDEWHDWYDLEHLPERAALPGFLTATWWRATDRPHASLGLYDLGSVDVLESPDYLALRGENESPWTTRVHRLRDSVGRPSHRHLCEQVDPGRATTVPAARHLRVLRADVEPGHEHDYARWREQARQRLSDTHGVLQARSFVTVDPGGLHRHLLVVELDRPPGADVDAVLDGPVPTTRRDLGSYRSAHDARSDT